MDVIYCDSCGNEIAGTVANLGTSIDLFLVCGYCAENQEVK